MAKPLLSDELWDVIEPLLPGSRPIGPTTREPIANNSGSAGSSRLHHHLQPAVVRFSFDRVSWGRQAARLWAP